MGSPNLQSVSMLKICTLLIAPALVPQVRAMSAGKSVATEQLLNMTNAIKLEGFRNLMVASRSLAAAQTTTLAASLQLNMRSLNERTAAAAREQRIHVRRLQRQQIAALAPASGAPALPQPEASSGKRKRGGVGVSKKCAACGLHKTNETGHTNTTCPTHCRVCKTRWLDPEQRKGCSCQI